MPGIPTLGSLAPVCPMCDGPCTHEFERSDMRIPDRLPEANTTRPEGVDAPVKVPTPNRKGRRAVHGPDEDRAHHLAEDRSR